MRANTFTSFVLLVFLITACGPSADQPDHRAPAADIGAHAEIDWVDGTVEQAFALAKELNKPLFLYWGAIWCPPCHYLKNKVFKHPEFVEQSRDFIAVYLDGDTDRAQQWGERLAISGYPTVLVLNPDGEEVMRMSSGIPVDEYNRVLAAARQNMRPIKQILEEVLAAGAGNAEAADLELLANYSWGQDTTVELSGEERLETFRALYQGTPSSSKLEKSKFLANYLNAAGRAAQESPTAEPILLGDERADLGTAVLELLSDRAERNSNVFFVAFGAVDVTDLLEPEAGERREQLISAWETAAAAMEEDDSLSVTDRLYVINCRIMIARSRMPEPAEGEPKAPLPDDLLAHIRDRIAWAGEAVKDESELQAAMNTMTGLLSDADLIADAKALITERIDDTLAPHYYMSWMADLEEQDGNVEEALRWSRRAYDSSEGPYTRFQWGTNYLRDAMRLAPEDVETVEQASNQVLPALLALEDAFANRNWTRWQRLEKAYREWGEDGRGDAVARIQGTVLAACERFAEGEKDSPRARCSGFLGS